MSDPKTADKSDKVTIPPKAATSTPSSPAPAKAKDTSDTRTLSSVGAELHPDAVTKKVDGKVTLDAGGSHPAAAPLPTPAEAVLYPSTGGLPDTGPNSKYVLGTYTGPELYNRDGQRVNADGQLIDEVGNVIVDEDAEVNIPERRIVDKNMMRQPEVISAATKAEMDAGKKALSNR